ncbi:MAG: hypothetical protein HRT44_03520 [Bdellovibrionales bacterium]|nr:hypothetical protein [Bdellovibrionales bacterium]NQZ18315.1 hypothetical protein [Bdellovibrionales bacterium]
MKKAYNSQLSEAELIRAMQNLLQNSDFKSIPDSFKYRIENSLPIVEIELIQQIDGEPITLAISIE